VGIDIRPYFSSSGKLADLTDVSLTGGLADQQMLYYDAASAKWKNTAGLLWDEANNILKVVTGVSTNIEIKDRLTGNPAFFLTSAGGSCFVDINSGGVMELVNMGTGDVSFGTDNALYFSIHSGGDITATGDIASATLTPGNGVSGSFTTSDPYTVTVTNGIITSIV